MPKFRYIGGTTFHYKAGDEVLGNGDVLECDEEEIESWQDVFERVEEETNGSDDEADESGDETAETADEEAPEPPFDPAELTVSELEQALEEGDFGDEELDALEEAEDGDRKGAVEAIEDAR